MKSKEAAPPKSAAEPFKHPSRKAVIIVHYVQIALSLVTLILACLQIGSEMTIWEGDGGSNYVNYTTSFLTISAFASFSIAIHAALAILQTRSECRSTWLFLILHNVAIMTLGLGSIVTTMWSWYLFYAWIASMVCMPSCVLLSIPSTIRAAKLRRHARRASKLATDAEQGEEIVEVWRKSVDMEDEPKPLAAQSIKSQHSSPENRESNSHKTPSRPISTVISTAETTETTANWSNGTGSATLDPFGDQASETHSLPSYGSRLSKDMSDEINRIS